MFIKIECYVQVVQRVAGADVAPVWFQVAIAELQQQIQQQIAAVQASLLEIRQDIVNQPIKRQNFNAMAPESPIYPLEVNGNVPAQFPAQKRNLEELNAAGLNPLLEFYHLDVDGTLPAKRRRLAAFIGLR